MPWLYANDTNPLAAPRVERAKAVMQQIIDEIKANVIEKRCFLGRNPEDLSPWGLLFAYHVCLAHVRYEMKSPELSELVNSMKRTMVQIDTRWNAAGIYRSHLLTLKPNYDSGAYLQLLEAHEVIHRF